jgi:flavodoxin
MKSSVVYYSLTGKTAKIAEMLFQELGKKGEVEVLRLSPLDESTNFFKQGERAFRKKKAQLAEIKTDLREFDLVCFGTPVWAFGPTPAMRAYLDSCSGLEGKTILLFVTSGGMGNEKCLREMESILKLKQASSFKYLSLNQSDLKDQAAALNKIQQIV